MLFRSPHTHRSKNQTRTWKHTHTHTCTKARLQICGIVVLGDPYSPNSSMLPSRREEAGFPGSLLQGQEGSSPLPRPRGTNIPEPTLEFQTGKRTETVSGACENGSSACVCVCVCWCVHVCVCACVCVHRAQTGTSIKPLQNISTV